MEAPTINNKQVITKKYDAFAHLLSRMFGEIIIELSCVMSNNSAPSGVLLSLALCRRLKCSTRVIIANIICLSIGLHFKKQVIKK